MVALQDSGRGPRFDRYLDLRFGLGAIGAWGKWEEEGEEEGGFLDGRGWKGGWDAVLR